MPIVEANYDRQDLTIIRSSIAETNSSTKVDDQKQNETPKPGQILRRNSKDFIFHTIIGEGSFSTVYKGQDVHSMKNYAIKVMDKRHILRLRKQACVKREKEVLQTLNAHPHPFFVKLYCTFQDSERLFIVLSYAKNGEILNYINRSNGFDLETSRFYAAELVVALQHLHRTNIIHRDLKPENILLDWDMHIKITDFGSATFHNNNLAPHPKPTDHRMLSPNPVGISTKLHSGHNDHYLALSDGERQSKEQQSESNHHLIAAAAAATTPAPANNGRGCSFVGTAQYVSPEVLTSKQISYGSDLWALGCVLFQFLTGHYPFKANNEYHIFQKIINLNYSFPPDMDPDAKDLIENLIKIDPVDRLGSLETGGYTALEAHPFFLNAPSIQPLHEIHTKTSPLAIKYPLEVRNSPSSTPTKSDPKLPHEQIHSPLQNERYKLVPGLDDGQLNRLHGLGMMLHESFSELSLLGSQITPELVTQTVPTVANGFDPHNQLTLYSINAESSSSKNSTSTAMSSTGPNCNAGHSSHSNQNSECGDHVPSEKSRTLPAITKAELNALSDDNETKATNRSKKSKFLTLPSRQERKVLKKKSLLLFTSSRSTENFDKDRRKHSLPLVSKKRVNTGPSCSSSNSPQSGPEDGSLTEYSACLTAPSLQNYEQFTGGRKILKGGLVDKRVGLFSRRRMLLLTEGPHLYYVDPVSMALKGEIPWSPNLRTEAKSFKIFHVHTPKRTYYLEDPQGYALKWCQTINEVHKQTYGGDCDDCQNENDNNNPGRGHFENGKEEFKGVGRDCCNGCDALDGEIPFPPLDVLRIDDGKSTHKSSRC